VDDGIGRGRRRGRRWGRGLHRFGRWWARLRLLVDGLAMTVLRVLVRLTVVAMVAMVAMMAVVRPGPIGRGGDSLLGHRLGRLARSKQADRQGVGFHYQTRFISVNEGSVGGGALVFVVAGLFQVDVAANLGIVTLELLLALHFGLILVGALGRPFGPVEEGVKGTEGGARDPNRPRPLKRCCEHAALLDALPLASVEIEPLRCAQCRQWRALSQPHWQRLLGRLRRTMGGGRCRCHCLDGDAGSLALQRRPATLGRRLGGRLGRGSGGIVTGARPRGPPWLRHVVGENELGHGRDHCRMPNTVGGVECSL